MGTMRDLGGPTACPHKPGTPEHTQWMRTWTGHEMDARRITGQADADTAAAKATANADFTAAGYDRPDPVVEILGPDAYGPAQAGAAALHSAHWHVTVVPVTVEITIDTDDLRRTLDRFAEKMASAFGGVAESYVEEVRRIVDAELRRSNVPASTRVHGGGRAGDRKRHGSAAVCPTHGPTKGGLCRRCAR